MHTVTTPISSTHARGFTLAELAIVLLIVAILAAALIVPLSGREESRRRHETEASLQEIREALIGFAIIHKRLPCPTLETNPANANYGLEDTGCGKSTEGYLPWRTLGVEAHDAWGTPRTAAADPWTGYWRYRVDSHFSSSAPDILDATALADWVTISDPAGRELTVHSYSGSEIAKNRLAIAVVYSTGANRVGNLQNSSYESTSSQGTPATYTQGASQTDFDDILIWISQPLLVARMAAAGAL